MISKQKWWTSHHSQLQRSELPLYNLPNSDSGCSGTARAKHSAGNGKRNGVQAPDIQTMLETITGVGVTTAEGTANLFFRDGWHYRIFCLGQYALMLTARPCFMAFKVYKPSRCLFGKNPSILRKRISPTVQIKPSIFYHSPALTSGYACIYTDGALLRV